MPIAELAAAGLVVVLVIADWWRFTRANDAAVGYGCRVTSREDTMPGLSPEALRARFDGNGRLALAHGMARLSSDGGRILLRPQYDRLAMRFRTPWPIMGTVEWTAEQDGLRLRCRTLMPWSSALLTMLWFAVVGFGTLTYLVRFVMDGGAGSLEGLLVGLGSTALGALVFVFGLITAALSYRLEDDRLRQAYREWREAVTGEPAQPVIGTAPGTAGIRPEDRRAAPISPGRQ